MADTTPTEQAPINHATPAPMPAGNAIEFVQLVFDPSRTRVRAADGSIVNLDQYIKATVQQALEREFQRGIRAARGGPRTLPTAPKEKPVVFQDEHLTVTLSGEQVSPEMAVWDGTSAPIAGYVPANPQGYQVLQRTIDEPAVTRHITRTVTHTVLPNP